MDEWKVLLLIESTYVQGLIKYTFYSVETSIVGGLIMNVYIKAQVEWYFLQHQIGSVMGIASINSNF